jgi:aminoglycoside phosphotransferase
MAGGPPQSVIATPPPVVAVADGCAVHPVWVNVAGGITFAVGSGRQRRFVKWAPAGSGIDLGAEAARLRWAARFTAVPRLLGEGADTTGSWIITSALPGQMAVTTRWKAQPHTAVTAIGQGLRALHDALPVRNCPFSWSASQRLAQARRRAGQGLVSPDRWHPGHQHLTVPKALEVLWGSPTGGLTWPLRRGAQPGTTGPAGNCPAQGLRRGT